MDFLAIISAFLSVAGATHAASSAMSSIFNRKYLPLAEDTAKEASAYADSYMAKTSDNYKGVIHSYIGINTAIYVWRLAYFIPIIMFSICAYIIAIHVLLMMWDGGVPDGEAWYIYKWLLLLYLCIDMACLLAMFLATYLSRKARNLLHRTIEQAASEDITRIVKHY